MYETWGDFQAIFLLSFLMAASGFLISKTVKHSPPSKIAAGLIPPKTSPISLDRFFLVKGWSVGLMLAMLSFSYGVLSTYLAIYAKEELGMTQGAAIFFLILSVSLMVSRFTGSKSLRAGRVVHNATVGMCVSVFSYLAFAAIHNYWGFFGCAVILGLGNGHMFPAVQTMFVNLAPNNRRGTANSSMLTSWDLGVGAGVVIGGIASELSGYSAAFWIASIVNIVGVLFFFAYVRRTYNKNKLR
jgi:predicted MFS family arabinose efflux permease